MAADEPAARKRKKAKKPLEPLTAADDSSANCKFARALGSVDWHTREQGLQALTVWLARNKVAEQDLVKIWKALFFCFWHSDQAHIQAELAERLAGILPHLSPKGALLYFQVFGRTMQREWFGIDHLRLDKFMMLARKFMRALFALLRDSDWDAGQTAAFCGFLAAGVFSRSDTEPSAGFALHLADVAVAELCGACEGGPPVPADALQAVLEPFGAALAATKRPALAARLQDGVFGELLLRGCAGALADIDQRALAARLFELGARQETRAHNREVLYSLSKAFERASAKRQRRDVPAPAPDATPAAAAPSASAAAAAAAAVTPQTGTAGKKQANRKAAVAAFASAPTPARPAKTRRGDAGGDTALAPLPADEAAAAAGSTPLQSGAASALKAAAIAGKGGHRGKRAGAPAAEQAASAWAAAASTPGEQLPAASPGVSTPRSSKARPQGALLLMNGTGGKKRKSMSSLAAEAAARRAAALEQAAPVASSLQQEQPGQASPAVGTPGMGASTGSTGKKQVKFALKKNLYFTKGGPVPPVDLRTPPTAQPKGSALKKSSSLAPAQRAPKSPKSVPRARAAMFF